MEVECSKSTFSELIDYIYLDDIDILINAIQ